jgi:hypothetical protein
MATFLVVANQTASGDELLGVVTRLVHGGPHHFHLVAPASPARDHLRWTEGDAYLLARENLEKGLARLHEVGATAAGSIGDANPLLAIEDALRQHRIDALVISTLDERRSIWTRHNLAERAATKFGLPVIHVAPDPTPGAPVRIVYFGDIERLMNPAGSGSGATTDASRSGSGSVSGSAYTEHGDRFHHEVNTLRAMLTTPTSRLTLRDQLSELRTAFARHAANAESDDGSFAELVAHAPRLTNRVDTLRRNHEQIATAIQHAVSRLDEHSIERAPTAGPDPGQRRELTEINQLLDAYLHQGLGLYHEAFSVDLQGE